MHRQKKSKKISKSDLGSVVSIIKDHTSLNSREYFSIVLKSERESIDLLIKKAIAVTPDKAELQNKVTESQRAIQ